MTNNYPANNSNNYNYPSETLSASREAIDVNISQYLIKLRRRWKLALAVFLLTAGITTALSLLLQKTYQAQGKLLFKQNSTASLTGVGKNVGELKPLLVNQSPLSTQIEVITSDPVLQQTIDQLKLVDDQGKPIKPKDFEKKLSIELVGGSDVIEITYAHPNPKVAADVVNTLMNTYINEQIRTNQSEPASAREFINKQLPQIESQVSQAESELRNFKESNQVVNLTKEAESTVMQMAEMNSEISKVAAQLQGTMAQSEALQSQLNLNLNQAIAANQLGASPVVDGLLKEMATVESELAKEKQRFLDNHPSIQSLEEKKASLNKELKDLISQNVGQGVEISEGLFNNDGLKENQLEKFITLEIDKINQQRQLSSLYQTQESYLERAQKLPSLEQKEKDLIRKVKAAQNTYETLLTSLQEVQLAENQQNGNAQIIELAKLPEKGSSGRMAFMLVGILLGLLLSNLSVLLVEMQDRSLKTVAEIKNKFGYKVLGLVPKHAAEENQGIIVQKQPDSFASEVYRMIQANLKFMSLENSTQVILVTSSVPEEGKSTVSANLAAAIAQLGKRVLLIDGDLRKPSQHRLWNLENFVGLRDVIVAQKPLSLAVSKPLEKLDLLTAGELQSNPLALLDSEAMSELITQSRKKYDLILIDAPPLPVTADVLTLSKLVDGIVFISRPGVVEHESAELAQEALANSKKTVLGMVINGINSKEFDRYSYYAKYAKGYFPSQSKQGNEVNGNHSQARV
ncbi:putative exopolysaccharide biosynthesis protein [Stanieria sp. NIES-3757]|nr:putative exopolysaccharide biosynthesis protein [Stanieria sp. NIES-3757]